MPALALVPHPITPEPSVRSLQAMIIRGPTTSLQLRYALAGVLERLNLSDLRQIERGDKLWEHTCFEVFLKPRGEARYMEMNFAPSGAFAAYSFTNYREGMAPYTVSPSMRSERTGDGYHLEIAVECPFTTEVIDVAISAVIENAAGQRSYWALGHAPGKPDFHHADAFKHTLRSGSPS